VKIHPTAIVSAQAEVEQHVEIGPFCIVEPETRIAAGCRLVAHVTVKSGTTIGSETTIYEGTVLGGLPQHSDTAKPPGKIVIGSRNVLREHVTVHRAMHSEDTTRIGDDCLLMVGSHVAHDCLIDNRVTLTNGVMLGGHVEVGQRACIGGNVAVHQFCRIGPLVMIAGCARVVQDVPPYVLTDDAALVVGLNKVGLRRAGFRADQIDQLKAAYRLIYREGHLFEETISQLQQKFASPPATEFAKFFQSGTRGFVQERRSPPRAAIRIHSATSEADDATETSTQRRKAG